MAKIHTHYDNLKVARNAPPEVIRAAYKTLSQRFHPDRNGGDEAATRAFQIINTAYETLSDPVKRKDHDQWIEKKEAEMAAAKAAPEPPRTIMSDAPAATGRARHTRNPVKTVALSLRGQTTEQRTFTYLLCSVAATLVLLIFLV